MPKITAAFNGWGSAITLQKVVQTVVNSFVTETITPVTFQGVIQPLSPRAIQLKPEGQRSFEWLQIHCYSSRVNLDNNDRIIYNGKRYKIMANNDYSNNNYIEYHAVKDYE